MRLIGIDAPERKRPATPVECGGKQASANMLRLSFSAPEDSDGDGLLDREGGQGRRVTLTTDPTQDTLDRYRRLLAYVETRSGNQLNIAQVAAGWALLPRGSRRQRQRGAAGARGAAVHRRSRA